MNHKICVAMNNDLRKDVETIEAEKKKFENKAEHSFQELQVQNDALHNMILELQKRDELVDDSTTSCRSGFRLSRRLRISNLW
jgi:hypothetical protein